jgi:hypothetical protein
MASFIASKPAYKHSVLSSTDNLRLHTELLDLEEHDPQRISRLPIGVVYSAAGNKTQWDMWNNRASLMSPASVRY